MTGSDDSSLLSELGDALEDACQPTNDMRIVQGRDRVLALPRAPVLAHLEAVASETLVLSDYREYRRWFELAERLDKAVTQRLVALGLGHDDADLREAAEDSRR